MYFHITHMHLKDFTKKSIKKDNNKLLNKGRQSKLCKTEYSTVVVVQFIKDTHMGP